MNNEEIKKLAENNAKIPDSEIRQDIIDTENEVYKLIEEIRRREEFIHELKVILEYREIKKYEENNQ